jgi:hypothetical protein
MSIKSKLGYAVKEHGFFLDSMIAWHIENNDNAPVMEKGDVVIIDADDIGSLKMGSYYLIQGGLKISRYQGKTEASELEDRLIFESDDKAVPIILGKEEAGILGRVILVGNRI